MTLRHLKIFISVCECGGATRAAEELHVAQPVVSTAVAELENYYGVRLFERISQRLILTDRGRELLVKAKDAVAGFDDFERLAREGSEHPTVRIGCSLTIAKTALPTMIGRVWESFPSVDIRVSVNKTFEIENLLLHGDLDFGMIEDRVSSPSLRAKKFSSDRLVCVCAPDYPIGDGITLARLASERLLLRDRGSASREFLDRTFASHKLTCDPIMESASNSALIAVCASGFGVAVQPEDLVLPFIRAKKLRQVDVKDIDLSRDYFTVIHKNKRMTPLQDKIIALCTSVR